MVLYPFRRRLGTEFGSSTTVELWATREAAVCSSPTGAFFDARTEGCCYTLP